MLKTLRKDLSYRNEESMLLSDELYAAATTNCMRGANGAIYFGKAAMLM